jgi:cytochrome c553
MSHFGILLRSPSCDAATPETADTDEGRHQEPALPLSTFLRRRLSWFQGPNARASPRPERFLRAQLGTQTAVVGILAFALVGALAEPVVPGFDRLARRGGENLRQGGYLLLSELGCTACHAFPSGDVTFLPPVRRAPLLNGVGSWLRPAWIRSFLLDPANTHRGRTMPDMLHRLDDTARRETVENLMHFLMSEPGPAPRVIPLGDRIYGERLYRQIGCVACHPPHPVEGIQSGASYATLPSHLAAKYTLDSLMEFLLAPATRRPGGRMPSDALDANEASDLAAYLIGYDPAHPAQAVRFTPDPRRVKAGRAAFQSIGCAACHERKGISPTTKAKPLATLNGMASSSCLENPGPGMPAYALSTEQRRALRSALSRMGENITRKEKLDLWLNALNCLACHERDDQGGIGAAQQAWLTGDERLGKDGRFPPHLSGVGAKLKRDWIERVLAGQGRVRPYLNMRMPLFGKPNTDGLASLLVAVDQDGSGDTHHLAVHGKVEAGRKLAGTEGGMGCITCHGWKSRPGLTMNAVNLSTATTRLQPDWFRQYLLAPATLRPGTLMPEFWPDGVSANPGVLEGDTEKQIASLWRFLTQGTNAPPGYPTQPAGRFLLVPQSEVIVQRGFIEPAGTHAIAAGFPEGMHFVFDAESCQLKAAWKGAYLDAYKLWFSRLDPTAKPAGSSVQTFPKGLPFEIEGMPSPRLRFKGYSLTGPNRAPVFLYQIGPVEVSDLITPQGSSWHRRLALKTDSIAIRIRLNPVKTTGLILSSEEPSTTWQLQRGVTTNLNLIYSW